MKYHLEDNQLTLFNPIHSNLERQITFRNNFVRNSPSAVFYKQQHIHRDETMENIGRFKHDLIQTLLMTSVMPRNLVFKAKNAYLRYHYNIILPSIQLKIFAFMTFQK
jgi:hypothetical protein